MDGGFFHEEICFAADPGAVPFPGSAVVYAENPADRSTYKMVCLTML